MRQFGRAVVASGACLVCAWAAKAQAPPGPLAPPPSEVSSTNAPAPPAIPKKPEVRPRPNILGDWQFNKDESDDARQKLKNSREADNSNRGSNNGGYGGPRMGGGWPGGPMGGGPYGGGGYPRSSGGSDDYDRLGDLVNPPHELRLSQKYDKDPEVQMVDDREHKRAIFTDGRKLEKSKDPAYEEIAAHWDGNKLVTDEKASHNGKMSRTYEVSPDGKQLWETVHITDSKGNHPVTVRYVYDAVDKAQLIR